MQQYGALEEGRTKARNPSAKTGGVGQKVGEALVAAGSITPDQLEEALLVQRKDRRELGEMLLSLGYVVEDDMARALARRLRLEFVELTERDVDRQVASVVDRRALRKHGVIPLRVEGGRLIVATSEPNNFYALEDLTMLSGYPVTPVVAIDDEIERVFNRVFAVGEEVTDLLEEAASEDGEEYGDLEIGVEATLDEKPIIRLVSAILQQAVADEASDVHVEPRARELAVRMRIDGVLREAMSVPPKLQGGVIARLRILANLDIAERRLP